ncbi:hypothetical protein RZS08_23935, partial [Arthrospira platensis SPKY1]|nr:hypothetical protein [Arthrospira platensis SPKY1]
MHTVPPQIGQRTRTWRPVHRLQDRPLQAHGMDRHPAGGRARRCRQLTMCNDKVDLGQAGKRFAQRPCGQQPVVAQDRLVDHC